MYFLIKKKKISVFFSRFLSCPHSNSVGGPKTLERSGMKSPEIVTSLHSFDYFIYFRVNLIMMMNGDDDNGDDDN